MSDLSSIEYFAKIRKIMENISLKHMCRLIHIALSIYSRVPNKRAGRLFVCGEIFHPSCHLESK